MAIKDDCFFVTEAFEEMVATNEIPKKLFTNEIFVRLGQT